MDSNRWIGARPGCAKCTSHCCRAAREGFSLIRLSLNSLFCKMSLLSQCVDSMKYLAQHLPLGTCSITARCYGHYSSNGLSTLLPNLPGGRSSSELPHHPSEHGVSSFPGLWVYVTVCVCMSSVGCPLPANPVTPGQESLPHQWGE